MTSERERLYEDVRNVEEAYRLIHEVRMKVQRVRFGQGAARRALKSAEYEVDKLRADAIRRWQDLMEE